jgi:ribonuclease-3
MNDSLQSLQARLNYRFLDPALLEMALTHPSVVNESAGAMESNQRLEFLGDAVLQLVLSEEIYRLYPQEREGVLTQRRKILVEGKFTAQLAAEIQLDACLRVPAAGAQAELKVNPSALEDAFEALIAALFLDAGYETARRITLAIYGELDRRLEGVLPTDNPKGQLQELVQSVHGNNALHYEVTGTSGQDHQRAYEVIVCLLDRQLGSGTGTSKKLAEEAAARAALATLRTTPLS